MTGSTRSCWPTRCAPTGPGCARCCRTARPPSPCGRPAGPARTWPVTGSRCATSCAPTSRSPSPAPSACSPSWIRRSAWRSWPASTARTGPAGSRPGGWPPGWQGQGYCGRKNPAGLHARLAAAPRGATGDDGTAKAHITRALLAVLASLVQQIKALNAQIAEQLALHADAHIFTSLPRSGTVRAARLLAETGDCRARFPTPEALICLAGVAPSTRKSGKTTYVDFRWAAGKQLRDAVLRLRRRLPPRQPVGSPAVQRCHCARQRLPPRHPHPRPRLAVRYLALLAEPHRLRPRPAQSSPAHPRRRKTGGGLTQGYS